QPEAVDTAHARRHHRGSLLGVKILTRHGDLVKKQTAFCSLSQRVNECIEREQVRRSLAASIEGKRPMCTKKNLPFVRGHANSRIRQTPRIEQQTTRRTISSGI